MATSKPAAPAPAPEETKPASTDLATQRTGVIAPDFMNEDFGGGFGNADKDSYAIPFIQILQKMSPMVDEDDPKHLEGAKAGMLYNTVTQKLIDGKTGITIIPCAFKRSYILWGGRESAEGGFKGEITPEAFDKILAGGSVEVVDGRPLVKDEKGETHPKKSDYYSDTRSHYVVYIDPETGERGQAIISLSSTQIKASKMLMTAMQQKKMLDPKGTPRTPPMFSNIVKMTTVPQANDKGSWSGAKFELTGVVTDPDLYFMAREFFKAIEAGEVKVDHSKNTQAGDGDVSGAAQSADTF